jgi:hypothetical protein
MKQRLRPMLGLTSFKTAEVVIGGIELAEKIKKGQYKMRCVGAGRRCPRSGKPRWLPNWNHSQSTRQVRSEPRQLQICTRAPCTTLSERPTIQPECLESCSSLCAVAATLPACAQSGRLSHAFHTPPALPSPIGESSSSSPSCHPRRA